MVKRLNGETMKIVYLKDLEREFQAAGSADPAKFLAEVFAGWQAATETAAFNNFPGGFTVGEFEGALKWLLGKEVKK